MAASLAVSGNPATDNIDAGSHGTVGNAPTLEDYNLALAQIKHYKSAFDQAKSDLMHLQDTTHQVTDTDIKECYEELCDAIEKWIDGVDEDEERGFFHSQFMNVLGGQSKELSRLGLDQAGLTPDGKPILKDAKSFNGWMRWLSRHGTCNSVVMSLAIWRYLQSSVFYQTDGVYPLGVPQEAQEVFDEVYTVMKENDKRASKQFHSNLGCPKLKRLTKFQVETSLTADKWRSDTMLALVQSVKFKEGQRGRLVPNFSEELRQVLKLWITPDTLSRHRLGIMENIVRPACELQMKMACSQSEYFWKEPAIERDKPLSTDVAKACTLKDIYFWRPVSYNDGDSVFHCLFPALYRRAKAKETDQLLVKHVILTFKRDQFASATPVSTLNRRYGDESQHVEGQSRTKSISEAKGSTSGKSSSVWKGVQNLFNPSKAALIEKPAQLEQRQNASEQKARVGTPRSSGQSQDSTSDRSSHSHRPPRKHRSRGDRSTRRDSAPHTSLAVPTSQISAASNRHSSRSDYETVSQGGSGSGESDGREETSRRRRKNSEDTGHYHHYDKEDRYQYFPHRTESPHPIVDSEGISMSPVVREVGMQRDIHLLNERQRVQEKEDVETDTKYSVNREGKSY